jgi:hypothetical protein
MGGRLIRRVSAFGSNHSCSEIVGFFNQTKSNYFYS